MSQDGFELADAELCDGDVAQKTGYARRGKGVVDGLLHRGEGGRVLDGDSSLLEHGSVTSLRDQGPRILGLIRKAKAVAFHDSTFSEILEREMGIEPTTNSLEGCDSTTELLPRKTAYSVQRTAFSVQKNRQRQRSYSDQRSETGSVRETAAER